jgi:hypothetical protein
MEKVLARWRNTEQCDVGQGPHKPELGSRIFHQLSRIGSGLRFACEGGNLCGCISSYLTFSIAYVQSIGEIVVAVG